MEVRQHQVIVIKIIHIAENIIESLEILVVCMFGLKISMLCKVSAALLV